MHGETALIQDNPTASPLMETRPSSTETIRRASDQVEPHIPRLGGLVLTRHLGESIMIGDQVEVQVVALKTGMVRLKVVAPRTIAVHRLEVFEAIQAGLPRADSSPVPPVEPSTPRPGKPGGGLVLARSVRQSIMIGDDVQIMIVEVRPSTVKLRIAAPRSVAVHRREVFEALRAEQG